MPFPIKNLYPKIGKIARKKSADKTTLDLISMAKNKIKWQILFALVSGCCACAPYALIMLLIFFIIITILSAINAIL